MFLPYYLRPTSQTNSPWYWRNYPMTNAPGKCPQQGLWLLTWGLYPVDFPSSLWQWCTVIFSLYCQLPKLYLLINWCNLYYTAYSVICSLSFPILRGVFIPILAFTYKTLQRSANLSLLDTSQHGCRGHIFWFWRLSLFTWYRPGPCCIVRDHIAKYPYFCGWYNLICNTYYFALVKESNV